MQVDPASQALPQSPQFESLSREAWQTPSQHVPRSNPPGRRQVEFAGAVEQSSATH
jgi:hypothetical protein